VEEVSKKSEGVEQMSLIDRLFRNIRQQERDRLLALAKGDIRGCSGLDCEECDRLSLINEIVAECMDGENK
jgi:hypothetical protein